MVAATWQQQLEIAETIYIRMAKTEGGLDQSIAEWQKTLQNAENAGMMLNIKNNIINALEPSGLAIRSCIKNIQEIDKIYTIKTINTIANLGKISPPNTEILWKNSCEKGKELAKNKINRTASAYGNWNDFNVQIQMLNDIHKTIEFIQFYVNIIKGQYDRFEHDITQMQFMQQYVNKISQDSIQPRILEFSTIHSKLEEPRKIILNKIMELELAAKQV